MTARGDGMCRSGRHRAVPGGRCPECTQESDARYRASPRGRATDAAKSARYRLAHPEKVTASAAAYHAAHRAECNDRSMHYRLTTAGILSAERSYQKRMRG